MSKLVRDGIPNLMRQQGKDPVVSVVTGVELEKWLWCKLMEEAGELAAIGLYHDKTLEEMGDVIEVIYALASLQNARPEYIERERQRKRILRGGFDMGLVVE